MVPKNDLRCFKVCRWGRILAGRPGLYPEQSREADDLILGHRITLYTCPSCHQASIPFRRKWLSWPSSPARCSACGRASAIAISQASGTLVLAALFVTLSGFASVRLCAAWPLMSGCTVALLWYFWVQHKSPLSVGTEQAHQTARRGVWIALIASMFPHWFH